ncbi:hypothetical protein E2562_007515 [Oryza meyeriana var. granulata]|nr:hypothetical protein E2562_007515 [Oryza meyeriana var. granulata]
MAQDNAKEDQGYEKSCRLFAEGITDLSEFKKDGLKIILHEVVSFFENDVEKILAHTLATSEFGPEKPLPSNASGLFEDGITPACSKRQNAVTVPLSDVYKDEHGHLSSAIIEQVTRDIRAMEENGETHQEAVKKFSAGLLEKLDEMARGVDDMLHILASKCRCMTTAEKLELSERIHKLSEKAFDRVVEIIEMRRLANECSGKITFSLAAMDDVTLWRLYYCVQNALETNKT